MSYIDNVKGYSVDIFEIAVETIYDDGAYEIIFNEPIKTAFIDTGNKTGGPSVLEFEITGITVDDDVIISSSDLDECEYIDFDELDIYDIANIADKVANGEYYISVMLDDMIQEDEEEYTKK